MAVLNPDHFLEQADLLRSPPRGGAPRQVDLRRSISAAYYAVFHAVLTAATDDLVGATRQATARYTLVYRSIEHRTLRALCVEATKPQLSAKYRKYAPATGFGADLRGFAETVVELQEKRHTADYDPSVRFTTVDGQLAIMAARRAIERLAALRRDERQIFLTLLLFPPR